jgi:hypothetical protein
MPEVAIVPAQHDLRVKRSTDNTFRVTVKLNGSPVDLTGDTLTVEVKDERGGVVKIASKALTLEPQSGATLGQALMTFTKAELTVAGSTVDEITWFYEVTRVHLTKESVPVDGKLLLVERL